ncbi:MAG: DNA replication and repair protein RecF, partial [Oscillospiraceae bacterium]|nr:DNA replication and repair protein RecF [Oscillospiraceae bacterium]
MRILRFSAVRFRNFAQTALEPGPGVNVIFGENGQGKTNLIESVWLFTGCRSFRTAENAEMIRHGETAAALEAAFLSNGREQSARLVITRRRELTLNGFPEATSRRMLGVFPAIAFSPATLRMVQGSPGGRRRFLDIALSMLQPSYAVCLSKYIKTLAQRNAVLAKAGLMQAAALRDALSLWDEVLAKEAALLLLARRRYMERFAPGAAEFYSGAAGGREALSVRYVCKGAPQALFEAGDAEALAAQLRKS